MKYEQIKKAIEIIEEDWGDRGKQVIELAFNNRLDISFDEFLSNCTACGGNWGGMLLTGFKKLRPEIYEAIPDDMGHRAFVVLCATLDLLGVEVGG